MILIHDTVKKQVDNFWNHFHFHPTDAIEDAWGKRILDTVAKDGAARTVRMYTMFEDIVTTDENDNLIYDFRVNDLRLDYMIEKGFNILLSYNFMPPCIASNRNSLSNVSKNPTRYKGKMINTSVPTDYSLWEEVCYTYTAHIIERYGEERVSSWYLQCFNEPDIKPFFMSDLTIDGDEGVAIRLREYCKLYESFERGVRRASKNLTIGGPALAVRFDFLEGLLNFIKEKQLQMDFVSVHNYGGRGPGSTVNNINLEGTLRLQRRFAEVLEKTGMSHKKLVVDEWGVCSGGYVDVDRYPALLFRETEICSAYYAKMICAMIEEGFKVDKMLICLSGQHEMTKDFTGFRNFFTLNFIRKPIYNAYVLAAKLGRDVLDFEGGADNLFVLPTATEKGFAVMLTYADDFFTDQLPARTEALRFEQDITGRNVTVYCIDKHHTNPYTMYLDQGMEAPLSSEQIKVLREEGKLKPVAEFVGSKDDIQLELTANCMYVVTVED